MINASNYKPAVWVGKFVIAYHEEEACDPMGYKSDQND